MIIADEISDKIITAHEKTISIHLKEILEITSNLNKTERIKIAQAVANIAQEMWNAGVAASALVFASETFDAEDYHQLEEILLKTNITDEDFKKLMKESKIV